MDFSMSDAKTPKTKSFKVKARKPRGLEDRGASDIAATRIMLATIQEVYERYGFEALETPFIEYTDALGKFLPDQDRPNEGVFSFQDDDEQWLSLRYDLTAPLARYVAENIQELPRPFRSYRSGFVFRNEKPGPGRFRQFMQFDADTVGTASPLADAEMCMMMADTLEALGLKRGQYVIKVNNRKILDGVMEAIGLGGEENAGKRLIVLRAIDKLDRLGVEGVRLLLGEGRKDESGDFTKGAGLSEEQISSLLTICSGTTFHSDSPEQRQNAERRGEQSPIFNFPGEQSFPDERMLFSSLKRLELSEKGSQGVNELEEIAQIIRSADYGAGRVMFDSSVVRGLEYYTGTVFEAELLIPAVDEKGNPIRFGSVGGGGRYDGLIGRFRGESLPATGFSIGVSRLLAALKAINSPILNTAQTHGPVVVAVMDKEHIADYQAMASQLRNAGIRAEMYVGDAGLKAQFKYADKRNAPLIILQGGDEREKGEVQIKDLIEGAKAASAIATNEEWKASRPAQFAVLRHQLVEKVSEVLKAHGVGRHPERSNP
jgi:histidyl-tRNA synthetase